MMMRHLLDIENILFRNSALDVSTMQSKREREREKERESTPQRTSMLMKKTGHVKLKVYEMIRVK